MGIQPFSCEQLSLPEKIDRLNFLKNFIFTPLVVLIGENSNVLGMGFISNVGAGTVTLNTTLQDVNDGTGTLNFTVDLCCVCSIIDFPQITSFAFLTSTIIANVIARLNSMGVTQ